MKLYQTDAIIQSTQEAIPKAYIARLVPVERIGYFLSSIWVEFNAFYHRGLTPISSHLPKGCLG
jgi:hypothetical protein